jgi:hypothetical protein
MPQNENNAERREGIHSQTNTYQCERRYAIAWDALTYELVNSCLKMALQGRNM